LLRFFQSLENAKRPYHLVCHSHGGGVAWEALKQSVAPQSDLSGNAGGSVDTLRYLKSWTTVGTPFIRQSPPDVRRGRATLFAALRIVLIVGGAISAVANAVQGWLLTRSLLIAIPFTLVWPLIAVVSLAGLMYASMKE
jgi:alpha-beta hydrolase superfamily lysophospholipase